ncbi:MAG: hypothetical protein D6732_10910 [Methanobacteriota archaeon]|nr:MAG: hypothetical protein D6732_10910 [Euryarchaeota archaeon]
MLYSFLQKERQILKIFEGFPEDEFQSPARRLDFPLSMADLRLFFIHYYRSTVNGSESHTNFG